MQLDKKQTYDKERISLNIARLRKGGEIFEVVVDPDMAISFKHGVNVDIKDIIKSEEIFTDAKKGSFAPENRLKELFGTESALEVAKIILAEGEIQLTNEYRAKVREEKKKKIISLIAKNAIDPKTKLPHPPQRIENALEEKKVKIDEFKKAEDQLERVVDEIRPILPIRFETKKIEVIIPPAYAGKAYSVIAQFAKPYNEEWRNDGSYKCIVEIPAGLQINFIEKVNALTHGDVETRAIE